MEAFEYKTENLVVVELRGRVDEFNTSVLHEELNTILNTGKLKVIIDLSRCTFVSAHCLRAIWRVAKRGETLGGRVVLCLTHGETWDTIHEVFLNRVVACYDNIDEAKKSFVENPQQQRPSPPTHDSASSKLKNVFKKILKSAVLLLGLCNVLNNQAYAENDTFSLDEVLNTARENNGQIRIARLKMAEKEAEVQIAKSAGLPKMVGTLGYLYQSDPNVMNEILNKELNSIRSPVSEDQINELKTKTNIKIDKDVTLVSLGFSQIVFSGGLLRYQTDLKQAQRNEADAQFMMESMSIEEEIRNAYMGLTLTREKLDLIAAQQKALNERFEAVKRARAAKTISEVQFAELEVLKLKSEQQRLSAEREERSLRGLLNIAIGRTVDAPFNPLPTVLDEDIEVQSAEHYFEIAVHRYPELRRTMALIDTATAYQHIARAQSLFIPTAAVFGTVDHIKGIGDAQGFSWSLGVGLMLPIVDGGKSMAEFEKATSLAAQAQIAYEESEKKLLIDINDVLSRLREAKLQLELAKKTTQIASERKSEADRAVQEGQLPQYRLSEAESGVIEARMGVIAARSEFYRWYARLLALTGQVQL